MTECCPHYPFFRCSAEILTIAAVLSVPNPFLRPRDKIREADESKARFAHVDGTPAPLSLWTSHHDPLGDHVTLLNVFQEFMKETDEKGARDWCYENFLNFRALKSAENVRSQLLRISQRLGIRIIGLPPKDPGYYLNIRFRALSSTPIAIDCSRKSILSGFFMQVAHLDNDGDRYITVKDHQQVYLHPSKSLEDKPEWSGPSARFLTV